MARRKENALEGLLEITAMMPWWGGVGLAAVSYTLLHWYASQPVVVKTLTDLSAQIPHALASVFQYILPVVFLGGAVMSALRRQKRAALLKQTTTAGNRGALEAMTWREFEMLVGEYFRTREFTVTETGGGGADGGVDLVLTRGADRYYVQCKQWKALKVGVVPVRELFGVMAANGAAGGYVVTSGAFTDEAKRFAEGREIALIDGGQLTRLLREQDGATIHGSAAKVEVPPCPKCAAPMVERKARKGSNAGSEFWGCSSYPKCRGVRPR